MQFGVQNMVFNFVVGVDSEEDAMIPTQPRRLLAVNERKQAALIFFEIFLKSINGWGVL
jgi:hypothetical protein